MKMESKPVAILFATLALGVVLGMVGQGLLMRQRTQRVGELRRPPGFVVHMEHVLEPTAAQRDTLRVLLRATASRNEAIIASARGALRTALDSLQLQLAPLLSAQQRERLAENSVLPDPFRPPPPRGGGGMGKRPLGDDRPPPGREGPPPGREGPPPPRDGGDPSRGEARRPLDRRPQPY